MERGEEKRENEGRRGAERREKGSRRLQVLLNHVIVILV